MVGNKCDNTNNRVVLQDDAFLFASQMRIQFIETSAKADINVEQLFEKVTQEILDIKQTQEKAKKINKKKTKKSKCCQ